MANAKNNNLHRAMRVKNDEFYTRMFDVERELIHYRPHFKGAVVFCNCDDPKRSAFWRYFHLCFKFLGLKKLISTHHEPDGSPSYALIYENPDGIQELDNDVENGTTIPLKGNGDFRSPECIEFLKEADIVVTNPPFSLFREYVAQLVGYGKKFLIIGNKNAIGYAEIFPLIRGGGLWLGVNNVPEFQQYNGEIKKFGNIGWFTNLEHNKRRERLILWREYSKTPEMFQKYDNFDAINIDRVTDIPIDYDGVMGVPITFLDKFNPEQFELIGIADRWNTYGLKTKTYTQEDSPNCTNLNRGCVLLQNGNLVSTYHRIFIRRKT